MNNNKKELLSSDLTTKASQINKYPHIFSKKVNELSTNKIHLNVSKKKGYDRFFSPATKEWFNSIYTYNSSYIKSLPAADKTLMNLIKSYFDLYNTNKEELKSKPLRLRFRRVSVKKIFVSKAELKHTSSKVIITLYIFNAERKYLAKKIKSLVEVLLYPKDLGKLFPKDKFVNLNWKIRNYLQNKKTNFGNIALNEKLDNIENINLSLINDTENIKKTFIDNKSINTFEDKTVDFFKMNLHNSNNYNLLLKNGLEEELFYLTHYKHLLDFNKAKFEDSFLLKLANIINKIYNKKVEFNIVNLKYLHLNSDLLLDILALKLRSKKVNLLRILKKTVNLIKIPKKNDISLTTQQLKNNSNKILKVNSFSSFDSNKDVVNQLLINSTEVNTSNTVIEKEVESKENIDNIVLNSMKYKTIKGLRLETKGRLTRRLTAARSVFKVKWKGNLKNIDSSYNNLSTNMLRGHAKSNMQHTVVNSKTRVGAFGVQGWISAK